MSAALTWKRTPFGYVSSDRRFFLERGGRMTHGANAWLVWERDEDQSTTDAEWREQMGSAPRRTFEEISGLPGSEWYVDTLTEGGWLSEAKWIVEQKLVVESLRAADLATAGVVGDVKLDSPIDWIEDGR